MKTHKYVIPTQRVRGFWRSECGALSSEFAVVAALMTVLGVTTYETIFSGSREIVSSNFVIQNDGPNYSIDGSLPVGPDYFSESSPEETSEATPIE